MNPRNWKKKTEIIKIRRYIDSYKKIYMKKGEHWIVHRNFKNISCKVLTKIMNQHSINAD